MTEKQRKKLLSKVEKPARYTGGELGAIVKDKSRVGLRFALCFPDTYEIGMSHLGMKILYALTNSREEIWCERCFAPCTDMEAAMREEGLPLWALESGDPLSEFDVIGFSLQYELSYTNILNMLDLAGIPLRAEDRGEDDPILCAGGPCVCNPEPLADFFDLFLLGEGEEMNLELCDLLLREKKKGTPKKEVLRLCADIPGVYVPSLYTVRYHEDGTIAAVEPQDGVPATITKRAVEDFDGAFFPDQFVVPFVEAIHDRTMLEVMRGCGRGCRFCQAGFIYRPRREKSPETLNCAAEKLYRATGYDDISLMSLSTSDYSGLQPLLEKLLCWTDPVRVGLSLPSLRADNFSDELLALVSRTKKSGLTFAPEAGTQRLRNVINKNITEEEITSACRTAFLGGYTSVKLYFMMSLPTETAEDIAGIVQTAQRVADLYYSLEHAKGRGVNVSASCAVFVPKPFTPFQWEPQDTLEMIEEKQRLLRTTPHSKKVSVNYHEAETSIIEAVLARGDRRLGRVLEAVFRAGGRMESWSEYFSYQRWIDALAECGLSAAFYASRRRDFSEILPWDHLDYGIRKQFLIREAQRAYEATPTPSCMENCAGCGADRLAGGGLCHER